MDQGLDRKVAALAGEQHGVFTRAQVMALGASEKWIRTRLERGRWATVHPRTHAIAGLPLGWEGLQQAACLAAGGPASHRAGSHLWRFDGSFPQRPEVVVPRGRRARLDGVIVHESKDFDLRAETTIQGIPVTGLLRTVLDLGAVLSPERVTQTVDHVLRNEQATLLDLWDTYAQHRCRGRNGTGVLRAVLEQEERMRGLPDSYFERLVYDLLVGANLPAPVPQHEVRDGRGRLVARVDLAYPEQQIAIELLGKQFHYTPRGFEHDPQRRNRLEVRGWIVLEFTWRRYVDAPSRICHEVADALRHRSGDTSRR